MTTRTHHVPAARSGEGLDPAARWLALAVLCVSLLMVVLDNTVLNVAVIGSLLNTRYQDMMTSVLAPYHIPHAVTETVLGSLGGALEVAARVGGYLGAGLGQLARSAFASGMDLGLTTGACVAAAGCLIALIALPSKAPDDPGAD